MPMMKPCRTISTRKIGHCYFTTRQLVNAGTHWLMLLMRESANLSLESGDAVEVALLGWQDLPSDNAEKKRRYWKAYMENRTGEHFTRFKKQEKITKKAVQAAKRYYEKKLADNMNQKPFNAYLKSKTKTKPLIGPLKTDNNTVSDNTEMSTIFNNYFCSVFSIENTTNMQRAVTLDFMSPIRNVIFSRSR